MKKIAVLLFVLVFTAGPAFAAAEWNLYGSARLQSWYEMKDANEFRGVFRLNNEEDYSDTKFDLQGNSRVGATVKFNDAVSGQFELGLPATGGSVGTRLILGHWNFGAGTLSVGQGYTPVYIPISSQAYGEDTGFLNVAEPYSGRQPMVQLAMGGFKIALVKQHGQGNVYFDAASAANLQRVSTDEFGTQSRVADYVERDVIPKVEVAFGQKFGPVAFNVVGGYQEYEIDGRTLDFDVKSWLVGANVIFTTGPFRIAAVGQYTQNGRQFGQAQSPNTLTTAASSSNPLSNTIGWSSAAIVNNELYDNDTWGAGAVIGFQASKKLNFELGYAHMVSESDAPAFAVAGGTPIGGGVERELDNYYVQCAITLAPGVFIVPAVGVFDRKDTVFSAGTGNEVQKITYAGAKWQINF